MNTAQLEEAATDQSPSPATLKRVRAYLGRHLIAEYTAEPEVVDRYLAAVGPKFQGLDWEVDNLPADAPAGRPLPGERLWELAP